MRRFVILLIVLMIAIAGCETIENTDAEMTSEADVQKNTSEATNTPSLDTAEPVPTNQEEQTIQEPAETHEQKDNDFNDDGSIKIDVYVNDELMDVKIFLDEEKSMLAQSNNYSDFVQAGPIADFLGIECVVKGDRIELISQKYGDNDYSYETYVKYIDNELYVVFALFRMHTHGSLKQNDYSSMYLYTGDFERTDLPETLEECYAMLDEVLSDEDIEYLKNMQQRDLVVLHFGLGMWIRNEWLYPNQSKLSELLYEKGIYHVDNMSVLIIEGYVRYLNNEPCSLEDLLKE